MLNESSTTVGPHDEVADLNPEPSASRQCSSATRGYYVYLSRHADAVRDRFVYPEGPQGSASAILDYVVAHGSTESEQIDYFAPDPAVDSIICASNKYSCGRYRTHIQCCGSPAQRDR